MAGIAGTNATDPDIVDRMLSKLQYRGRTKTIQAQGKYLLGCCDSETLPSRKKQVSAGGKTAVIDGCLYNDETGALSDAEIVVDSYESRGDRFPEVLDGNFACAVVDGDTLFLARDLVGVKPLYYGERDGHFFFASEAKSLVDVADYVKEFPRGHIYSSREGFWEYQWDLQTPDFDGPEEAAGILAALMDRATEKRMRDGAISAAFLSGGIDSSVVTCLAKQYRPDLMTFVVGVEGSEDVAAARIVSSYLGTTHHEYAYTTKDIEKALPETIYIMESFCRDYMRSAPAHLMAGRWVAGYTSGILCGEGGDELLAGYPEYKEAKNEEELGKLLDKVISISHNTAIQRCERMNSASALDFRTPFLDRGVVDFCLKIPPRWKLYGDKQIEKWILRKAFVGRLPEEIVWRTKSEFARGAGSIDLMVSRAEELITDEEFSRERRTLEGLTLRSKEELYYYRLFKEHFPRPDLSGIVGRWDPLEREPW